MKSKYLNYVIKFLKTLFIILLISYLGAVGYFFSNLSRADAPKLTLQKRIKKSLITPIALFLWFIYVIIFIPSEKWGPSGPSAYSTPWA